MGSPRRWMRGRTGRLLVVMTLAAGIVGGLLAMHFGIGLAPAHASSIATPMMAGHTHPLPVDDGCADDCAPLDGESPLAAACVLGILVLQLLVALMPSSLRTALGVAAPLVTGPPREPAHRARPPDLDTLCISRT